MPLAAFGAVIAVVVAVALGPAAGRWLKTSRAIAGLLLFGFGLVLAATLTPDAEAMAGEASDGLCDLSRVGIAPIGELVRVTTSSLNVLLFVPLGLAVGMLPRTRTAALVTIAAFALTFVVEGTQLVVTALGRGCQAADIVDNLLGLVIGIALATVARVALPRLSRSRS